MNRFRITGMALAVLLICTMLFTGCSNAAQAKKPDPSAPAPAPPYVKVAYAELEEYLRDKASSTQVNYIEITGTIPKEDFKGGSPNPGELGRKLRMYTEKKVACKIAKYPENLTDMAFCFYNCVNLVKAPEIPSSVTNMESCFSFCLSLTEGPPIPENITVMRACFADCKRLNGVTLKCNYAPGNFGSAFANCPALKPGSIKVPKDQLDTYKANAAAMRTQADKFAASN